MSGRQSRVIKPGDTVLSSSSSVAAHNDAPPPSRRRLLSRASLIRIIFGLLVLLGSLVLCIDWVIAESDVRSNSLQSQLATCKEREDRVWNLGYEAGEKLGMYRVSIVGQDGESEAWAAWKEGFRAGEELGKRGVCDRFRF